MKVDPLIPLASAPFDFGAGPFALTSTAELGDLAEGSKLIVAFNDCQMLFDVVVKAGGELRLGTFLTPWEYVHWRVERRNRRWTLSTHERDQIAALRRFYRL